MHYQISNTLSGRILGIYPGKDKLDALETFALDAGYHSFADLLQRIPGASSGELQIKEIERDESLL